MIKREDIKERLYDSPCGLVALHYATGAYYQLNYNNGYISLSQMQELINRYLSEKCSIRYKYFVRKERKRLCDFNWSGEYIICVLGHYVYMKNNVYKSAFDNDNDMVVAYWRLEYENGFKLI